MDRYTTLLGRLLIAPIFIIAAIGKIGGYTATQGWMETMGVPGILLPAVILLELGGGLALLFGWQARTAAGLLAGFTIVAAAIFHNNLTDQIQSLMFMKNLAIAGGLLFITAHGAGRLSIDARRQPQPQDNHTRSASLV